ncbi:ABC transporter permease [Paenibacillus sp. 1P07SE]|uniref:fluoroquinolone export ABC transporter permease subunit n=1 Tax=Paenibacillus sp. 1P07SE TaxID=3132209 RepID=UPI0039A68491
MNTWRLLRFDVRFQVRHRFYSVYLVIIACYIGLLHTLPDTMTDKALVLLTFSDPSALGLLFAGGIILLERAQGVWDSLFATPIRLGEYLLAKCLSLGLLSLSAAFAIHVPVNGLPASTFYYTTGVVLTSCFFTLLGIAAALASRSINGFLIRSQAYALVFAAPLLGYLDMYRTPLYKLLPTEGSLTLIGGAVHRITPGEGAYAISALLLWIAVAAFLVRQGLHAAVRQTDGGRVHEKI